MARSLPPYKSDWKSNTSHLTTTSLHTSSVCKDFKHFGFAVSVINLNESGDKIVRILRKEACCVRFAPAARSGNIPYILYANWRNTVNPEAVERIEILNSQSLFPDLQNRGKKSAQVRKSVDSPPGMLTEDHHHTVHEERQVCYSSHLRPESLHL